MINRIPKVWLSLWAATFALLLATSAPAAGSKEMRIDARLIWGTNDEKSPNTNHTAVNPDLVRKLQKTFKWQYYFLVNRQKTNVTVGATAALNMSEHCTVLVKNLGDRRVEVNLIGDGKLVCKYSQPLPDGEELILAGDDKNNTAWFVVLRGSAQVTGAPAKDEKQTSPKDKDAASKNKEAAPKDSKAKSPAN